MLKLVSWGIGVYPLVAHIGIWTSHPRLAVSYLIFLLFAILLCPPRFSRTRNQVSAGILLISVAFLIAFDLDYLLIFLPPVVIPGILFWLFVRSLRKGSVPLITQFAQMMETDEPDRERKMYTRQVTRIWVAIFGFMILEGLVLAAWAPIEIWSWATHIGNYILIAMVLLLEILYRQHRFKNERVHIKQFILALAMHRWK